VVEVEVGFNVLHVHVMCVCGILTFIEFCVFKSRNVCVLCEFCVLGSKCFRKVLWGNIVKFWVVGEYDAPLVLSNSMRGKKHWRFLIL